MNTIATCSHQPWNKGELVGRKPRSDSEYLGHPGKTSTAEKTRDLALFNLAIDRKLRACDLTKLRVRDIAHGEHVSSRAIVMQQNNLKIFCLGRTEGLTVVARLVETANLLLAGRKHIAGITNSFCARLKLLG